MELEGGGVDTVPQARRPGAIFEHMPQVGTALGTLHLGAPHEQAAVLLFPHILLLDRRPETWPNRSGVVLCPRREERLPTDLAGVDAGLVVLPVFSGERSLGSFVDTDLVLQRRELLPELRFVERHHEYGRTLPRLKVSSKRRRQGVRDFASLRPWCVRILLPQGHPGPRGVLENGEPALAHDVGLGHQDLPASLLDFLLIFVDRRDGQIIDDSRLPVARLQSSDAAARTTRRLEQRVVNPRDGLEFPPEHGGVEFLNFLRFLHMELDVHDASGFRWVCHCDSSSARRNWQAYITIFKRGRQKGGSARTDRHHGGRGTPTSLYRSRVAEGPSHSRAPFQRCVNRSADHRYPTGSLSRSIAAMPLLPSIGGQEMPARSSRTARKIRVSSTRRTGQFLSTEGRSAVPRPN